MDDDSRVGGLHPGWWTAIFVAALVGIVVMTTVLFSGSLHTYVPVTLTSDRAGLVMESGAKVKMRGVPVGRVSQVSGGNDPVSLKLELFPDEVEHIPANVQARIRATTAFGAKYVDLIYPTDPSPQRLAPGAVLKSQNTSTEVNTVFQNLVGVLHKIDPAKLNGILSALAEGVRGQGKAIGEATTDLNQFLLAINARSDTIRSDWQAFKGFNDAYAGAAQNILGTLAAASTTSTTITGNASALDGLLLSVIGFSNSGINLLAPNQANLISAVNLFRPTADVALKYNPELTCMLVGADWALQHGMYKDFGGNGRSAILDAGLLFGDDTYQYPENLPVVGAKGGPDGAPGCGSLPYVDKNFPVRYVVTDTGWGTGIDVRPNPGVGHPFYADYFPVTRAVPEPPSIRGAQRDQPNGGPAPGPIPYPGAPPYGAPLYAPDGTPLYPGLPPAPPPGSPPEPGPPPAGTEPFVAPDPAQQQQTPAIPVPVPAAPSP
jgi:phospholipid/cholesterol/gamma-HCH transport system substrate-binding protein